MRRDLSPRVGPDVTATTSEADMYIGIGTLIVLIILAILIL